MKVLSLFDGISGAQVALKNLGIIPELYIASEINKHAIKVTQSNFPNTYQIGDVKNVIEALKDSGMRDVVFDLIIFGSPCQSLSIGNKNRKSLKGEDSGLFYNAADILRNVPHKHFFMENVASMNEESRNEISRILGVQPVRLNSSHFIPQNRDRLYWFNWAAPELPAENQIYFKDLLMDNFIEDIGWILLSGAALAYMDRIMKDGKKRWARHLPSDTDNKNSRCILANFKKGVPYNVLIDRRKGKMIRYFLPRECEKLQGFPMDYTKGIAKSHRYEAIGNSFTVPVIEHFLRPILK